MSDVDDASGLARFGAGTHRTRWRPGGGRSAAGAGADLVEVALGTQWPLGRPRLIVRGSRA